MAARRELGLAYGLILRFGMSDPALKEAIAVAPADADEPAPIAVISHGPTDVRSIALSILAMAAVIALLRAMQDVVIPLVLGALMFYALDPLVDTLEKWKCPRALAAALAILLLVSGSGWLAYSLRDQAMQVVTDMPTAAQRLGAAVRARRQSPGTLERVQEAANALEKTASETVGGERSNRVATVQVQQPGWASSYLWWGSMSALSLAGQAVMVLFLAYFLLLSDDLFKRKLVEVAGPTFATKKVTVQVLDDIARQIERFLLVQIFTSAVVGVATWLALWYLGVEQPAVWGLLAGVLNSVPYFGPIIVSSGIGVVGFLQFGTVAMAATVAGVAFIITTLEGFVLTPMLMSQASEMNQVAIFVGLIFWSWMWGVWGMLLAVPLLMVLKSVCDHFEDLQPIGKFLGK
jgi:predicted PurR-regulated permease PerM